MVVQILDIGLGNLSPICGALDKIPLDYELVGHAKNILNSEPIIIPGNANTRLQFLQLLKFGFDRTFFMQHGGTVLGICSGAQVLLEHTDEGGECLGIIPGKSIALSKLRIGWFYHEKSYYYFVHRYKMVSQFSYTTSDDEIASVVRYKDFIGLQFHPEKSGLEGVRVLRKYLIDT